MSRDPVGPVSEPYRIFKIKAIIVCIGWAVWVATRYY